MKIRSVKLNFILNLTRMFLGIAFIVITTPYITRILGPENLGKVEYVNSIGQLGYDFQRLFDELKINYIATDIEDLDITEIEKIRNFVKDKILI